MSVGPHVPLTSVAGHFLSMQPGTDTSRLAPEKIWYRGDEYLAVVSQRDKYKLALDGVFKIFSDPNEPGDSETMLQVLDIVEKALRQ